MARLECKCGNKDLGLGMVYDEPDTGYAYNLYICGNCGAIHKEDVWNNEGVLIINVDNTITDKRN